MASKLDMAILFYLKIYIFLYYILKDHPTFLEIGSFYIFPRDKQLSFAVFESIQLISRSGGSTFSLA